MAVCGLLGEKLGHSYSPFLHSRMASYEYRLFEVCPEKLGDFLQKGEFLGLNVTIPYKKAVMPYCAALSPVARRIGSVNTIFRRSDGSLYGDNTDHAGFHALVAESGIEVRGRKALVLGSGGASVTVQAVLAELGAGEVVVISRSGENNYRNFDRHGDAELLVNTTPLGMYPKNGTAAVDLRDFPALRGVLDVVYNPARTALLLQAEKLGIPHAGGLRMLAAQARKSAEIFTGSAIPQEVEDEALRAMQLSMQNIILIGMPGCGKTTISKMLGRRLDRPVVEADRLLADRAGMSIPEIFAAEGEAGFRRRETEILREAGAASGTVIATGGGAVTREENYPLLHQNGLILWLERDLKLLDVAGRPLSEAKGVERLYRERLPLYRAFADCVIDNNGSPEETVTRILEVLQ